MTINVSDKWSRNVIKYRFECARRPTHQHFCDDCFYILFMQSLCCILVKTSLYSKRISLCGSIICFLLYWNIWYVYALAPSKRGRFTTSGKTFSEHNETWGLPYQLDFPKPLTRPFLLKYVKLLGFGNQASLIPLQAPWGVTHEWTAFVLPSGLPVVM